MLSLKIIIGSTRPGRAADKVISWISSAARGHGGFSVDVVDVAWWSAALQQARSRGTLPPAIMRLMAARAGAGNEH